MSTQIDRQILAYRAYIRLLKSVVRLKEFCEWNGLPYPEPLRRMLAVTADEISSGGVAESQLWMGREREET
jgi:hypothetical protein